MKDDDNILKEVMPIFIDEAKDILDRLNKKLLRLESEKVSTDELKFLSEEVSREVHTLKGNASSVGLIDIERLVHALETSMHKMQFLRLRF